MGQRRTLATAIQGMPDHPIRTIQQVNESQDHYLGLPQFDNIGGTSRFVRQTTLTRTKSERPITRPA